MPIQRKRLENIRLAMERHGFDALFLPPSSDLTYVTGMPRRSPQPTASRHHGGWLEGALVTSKSCVLFTHDLRYTFMDEFVRDMPWIDDVVPVVDGSDVHALARAHAGGAHRIGLSADASAQTVFEWRRALPDAEVASAEKLLVSARAVKDEDEMERMRKAARATDALYAELRKQIQIGMTHTDILAELHHQVKLVGAEGVSFYPEATIRGPGAPAGLPGSEPESVELLPGRVLAFDLGIVVDGYCSDFGRTVFCGEPTKELARIYELVIEAHRAAIAVLRPGTIGAKADKAARDIIAAGGYGDHFIHRLGHGIGLDVHEKPFLMAGDDTPLETNMCFAVEPSVFLLDRGWIRVEDVVAVGPDGGVCLMETPWAMDVLA